MTISRLKEYFETRPHRSKNILLVDDEKDLGWILGEVTRDAGHNLTYACTFKEGIQKFNRLKNLDMAVVDLRLENKSGLTFIKKAKTVNPRVKFVMISAFGTPEIRKKARRLGISDFLDKPLKTERLLDIINAA